MKIVLNRMRRIAISDNDSFADHLRVNFLSGCVGRGPSALLCPGVGGGGGGGGYNTFKTPWV